MQLIIETITLLVYHCSYLLFDYKFTRVKAECQNFNRWHVKLIQQNLPNQKYYHKYIDEHKSYYHKMP